MLAAKERRERKVRGTTKYAVTFLASIVFILIFVFLAFFCG